MRPKDVRHTVDLEKFLNDLRSKSVTSPTGRKRKLITFRIRIRPNKVCHRTFMRDLAEPVYNLNLIDRMNGRGKSWAVPISLLRAIRPRMDIYLHVRRKFGY